MVKDSKSVETNRILDRNWDENFEHMWQESTDRSSLWEPRTKRELQPIVVSTSPPAVDDKVYVPDYPRDPMWGGMGERKGGRATVSRVTKGEGGIVYIHIEEHGCYHGLLWTNGLDNLQEELSKKYGYSPAYLKQ